MTIKNGIKKLRNILYYGGLSKENYRMVKDDVNNFNRRSLIVFFYFGFIVFVSLLIFTSIAKDSIITKN